MLVMATSFLAKALALPLLGRLAARIGAVRLLASTSLAVVPLGLLWIPSANVAYLVGVQTLAGFVWAGYELAVALVFFEQVPARERTAVITIYNLAVALATVAGAACGGLMLLALGADRTAYMAVFLASCLLRLAAIPVLVRLQAGAGRPDGGR
jgi:MFS family permease